MSKHAPADLPDHEAEDSARIEALTSTADITDETIEVYTNGACWYLAWWMHQLSGLTITTLGYYDGDVLDQLDHDPGPWDGYAWNHVGVVFNIPGQLGPEFLDIVGHESVYNAMDRWCGDEGEEHGAYDIDDMADFVPVITYDPAKMTEKAAATTRAIAELVLASAGVPLLPSAAA